MDHQLSLMRVIAIRLTVGVALGCSLYACKEDAGAQPQTSVVDGNASVPAFDRPPSDPGAAKAKPAADMAKPQAATEDGEDGDPQGDEDSDADAAANEAGDDGDAAEADEADEAAQGPLPDVEVANIGMHIGGEENTAAQKKPIRDTVSGHYDALKRCYAKAQEPEKRVTFGIDIRIPGTGGQPKVSNPRTSFASDVKECMVDVFANIDFPVQPRKQARMVSYSVRFTRK